MGGMAATQFPKRARDRARKIKSPEDFKAAEDRLRAAVNAGNTRTEKFWREVFGAYAAILQRRGKSEFADVWNLATNYSLTDEFGWTPPESTNG